MTPILKGPVSPLFSVNWKPTKACRVSSKSFFRILTIMTTSSPTPFPKLVLVSLTILPSPRGSGVSQRCSSSGLPFRFPTFNGLSLSAIWALIWACCDSLFFLFRCRYLLASSLSISCMLALGRSLEHHLTGPEEIPFIAFNFSSGALFHNSPPLVRRFGDITVSPTNEIVCSPIQLEQLNLDQGKGMVCLYQVSIDH